MARRQQHPQAEEHPRKSHIGYVCKQLAERAGPIRVDQLTTVTTNALCIEWKKSLKPWSQRAKLKFLRRILAFLATLCPELAHLPKSLPKPPRTTPRTRIASQEEIAKLLAHAEPFTTLLILLALDCGLRYSEARSINASMYDKENAAITFRQKGGSIRTIPVTPRIAQMFAEAPSLPPDSTTPFIDRYRGMESCHGRPRKWWEALRRRCGIRRDLCIHDLRRTVATHAYDTTKDLRVVQQLLGHSTMQSTLAYLAPHDAKNLRPLIEALQIDTTWKH